MIRAVNSSNAGMGSVRSFHRIGIGAAEHPPGSASPLPAVAFAACHLPARRAARLDPTRALGAEG